VDFYQQCYVGTGRQNYLNDNNNFRASRLKLLTKTKTIPLNKYLGAGKQAAHKKQRKYGVLVESRQTTI
jgi:hypothetical protein